MLRAFTSRLSPWAYITAYQPIATFSYRPASLSRPPRSPTAATPLLNDQWS